LLPSDWEARSPDATLSTAAKKRAASWVMTAETMRAKRRTYQNMHEIVKLAKKYSPKLVKGYSAGNISVVDKKSWLEVCDRKHRCVECFLSFACCWILD
jgi:hypothetical protein